MKKAILLGIVGFWCNLSSAGLIISLTDLGGTAPINSTGTGSLSSVVRAAADVWELAYNDSSFNHNLSITYRWATFTGGSTLGLHGLIRQGGDPNRETEGALNFNKDVGFFLDGTLDTSSLSALIASSNEYTTYSEGVGNYGEGSVNNQRRLDGATGDAAGRFDLFTVALHEIGHAMGISSSNFTFESESMDNDIDILTPYPFVGSSIPTTGPHINVANALMSPTLGTGFRKLPTVLDILGNAQISEFPNPNLNLDQSAQVPEPSAVLLSCVALLLLFVRRRANL